LVLTFRDLHNNVRAGGIDIMNQERTALLSVYHKPGIVTFAQGLVELGWNLLASGGTKDEVARAGIPVRDVAELVGGGAILGHKVVTLSRELHAGLLADSNSPEEVAQMAALKLPIIDLVAVHMYPLEEAISDGLPMEQVIAKTDIGGPTMLRAGVKGRRIVLHGPSQYSEVLAWLRAGEPNAKLFRLRLAMLAELRVANYVRASAAYMEARLAELSPAD
jgi:phosphoribosylaminoimidazolecarboxamide formyltransferase/IMP cyclohydrolase